MASTEAIDLLREILASLQRIEVNMTRRTVPPSVALAPPAKQPFHHNPPRTAATVDPCFAALAEVDGSPLAELTDKGAKDIQNAFDELRKTVRDVTADEIRARAKQFKNPRSRTADWPLTAQSLVKHWAKCAPPQAPSNLRNAPPEPLDWSVRFVSKYGANGWSLLGSVPQRVTRPHPNGDGHQVLRWEDLGPPTINLWHEFSA